MFNSNISLLRQFARVKELPAIECISDSWQVYDSVFTASILVMSDELQVGFYLSMTVFVPLAYALKRSIGRWMDFDDSSDSSLATHDFSLLCDAKILKYTPPDKLTLNGQGMDDKWTILSISTPGLYSVLLRMLR